MSLFCREIKSEDEGLSMATVFRWSVLCPGMLNCLPIEESLSCLMSDLWLVKQVWSGVDVSPMYLFLAFCAGYEIYDIVEVACQCV